MKLKDRATLISGAGRGLGRELALLLAEEGARLVLVARNREELAEVVGRVRASGGEAHPVAADVGDPSRAAALAGTAAALVGPIELLIHNASTLGPTPMPPLTELGAEHLQRVLAVNLVGPYALTQALVGSMILRGGGTIVQLSSDAAVEAHPGWGAYGASKAGFDQLGRIWAKELAPAGVRFLLVDPGEMNTRMHAEAMPEADPSTLAEPRGVAKKIVAMLGASETLDSGARLAASSWEASR